MVRKALLKELRETINMCIFGRGDPPLERQGPLSRVCTYIVNVRSPFTQKSNLRLHIRNHARKGQLSRPGPSPRFKREKGGKDPGRDFFRGFGEF